MDLTIIIPARNEEFLGRTIQDLLQNIEGNTEIIAILDGYLPNPALPNDPRVTVIYNPEAIGQRAGANQGARLAKGKYLMKVDAHCAFDKGFDRKMLEAFKQVGDNVTMIPLMRNLHAFDWICEEGHRRYQSPSGVCETCGKPTKKDVCWIAKQSPATFTFRFDKTMHFQYWGELAKREENKKGTLKLDGTYDTNLRETLSIQGSCFMITKEKWFELDICSEEFFSWGQQGVEVACKTWLSGGKVISNLNTWYAHMFRTRGGDFGFPYHNPQDKVNKNREYSRELFQKDKWNKAIRKFQWLLNKFDPPDWGISRGIIYYTHNTLDGTVLGNTVREKLLKVSESKKLPITSASDKKIDFGVKNVHFPSMKPRDGYLGMFKKILGALENCSADIVFFAEHDVLYHSSHFDFIPKDENTFYYNQNVYFLRNTDGHVLHYDVNQLSGLCVYRETALKHFRERFEMTEAKYKELGLDKLADGPERDQQNTLFNRFVRNLGFEPFTHHRVDWKNKFNCETWKSEYPNVDVKHGGNATGQRWTKEEYRNQSLLVNWTEGENWQIQGWDSEELKKLIAF